MNVIHEIKKREFTVVSLSLHPCTHELYGTGQVTGLFSISVFMEMIIIIVPMEMNPFSHKYMISVCMAYW